MTSLFDQLGCDVLALTDTPMTSLFDQLGCDVLALTDTPMTSLFDQLGCDVLALTDTHGATGSLPPSGRFVLQGGLFMDDTLNLTEFNWIATLSPNYVRNPGSHRTRKPMGCRVSCYTHSPHLNIPRSCKIFIYLILIYTSSIPLAVYSIHLSFVEKMHTFLCLIYTFL